MTCKGVLYTQHHLGIDTAQVKQMCRSIIKICDAEPHAVDSLLEDAYLSLSRVGILMKHSADRAVAERERYERSLTAVSQERQRIPSMAKRYPTYITSKRIEEILTAIPLDELEAIADRVRRDRSE